MGDRGRPIELSGPRVIYDDIFSKEAIGEEERVLATERGAGTRVLHGGNSVHNRN